MLIFLFHLNQDIDFRERILPIDSSAHALIEHELDDSMLLSRLFEVHAIIECPSKESRYLSKISEVRTRNLSQLRFLTDGFFEKNVRFAIVSSAERQRFVSVSIEKLSFLSLIHI